MNRVQMVGLVLALIVGVAQTPPATGQQSGAPPTPNIPALPPGGVSSAGTGQPGSTGTNSDRRVRALTEGPLHEAFLSPRKDKEPNRVEKAPPAPVEREARRRSAQRQGPMDRRLLGVGRGPQRVPLGDRNLARRPSGTVLGQRLLETG